MPFLLCLGMVAGAQYSISSMLPGGGVYLKSQLWTFSVVNTNPDAVDGKVLLEMKDITTKQTVLTAISGKFIIAPGAQVLQPQYLQPIQYTYGAGIALDQSPNGVLPAGQYLVCYQLFTIDHSYQNLVADDCVQLEVEPLSQLMLSFPDNGDTLETNSPTFNWIPPAPLAMFSNLNYDFLLSEVLNGQSPTDAVQRNLPFHNTNTIQQPNLQYPLQGRPLEKGKTYAWQIVARDQGRYTTKSEVWTFMVRGDSTRNRIAGTPYVKVEAKAGAPVLIENAVIKASYYHELSDPSVSLKIVNTKTPGTVLLTARLDVKRGQNFILYDLGKKLSLHEGDFYEAHFVNTEGRVAILRFYVKTNSK